MSIEESACESWPETQADGQESAIVIIARSVHETFVNIHAFMPQ
jgi:hypothetical protein